MLEKSFELDLGIQTMGGLGVHPYTTSSHNQLRRNRIMKSIATFAILGGEDPDLEGFSGNRIIVPLVGMIQPVKVNGTLIMNTMITIHAIIITSNP